MRIIRFRKYFCHFSSLMGVIKFPIWFLRCRIFIYMLVLIFFVTYCCVFGCCQCQQRNRYFTFVFCSVLIPFLYWHLSKHICAVATENNAWLTGDAFGDADRAHFLLEFNYTYYSFFVVLIVSRKERTFNCFSHIQRTNVFNVFCFCICIIGCWIHGIPVKCILLIWFSLPVHFPSLFSSAGICFPCYQ